MRRDELVVRRAYAIRVKDAAEPLVKVTYVGPARGRQCRIRYEQGELQGLEEWVATRDIACAWGERRAVLRDEQSALALKDANDRIADPVTEEAISTVMTASGEYGGYLRQWETDPPTAQRYWARAGLADSPLEDHLANYQDRHGIWHLSFATALKAAEGFAASEPESVELYIRGWESELKARGFEPGQQHSHDLLREWAPHFALARSWTQKPIGFAAEEEVVRLQRLVNMAIGYLRDAGSDEKARRLERALQGR